MIELKNISKHYDKVILDDISLNFDVSNINIIVGVNGSGKTTLLECMIGMRSLTSGEVLIDNYKINTDEFKLCIFYLSSDFYLPNYMTGLEYLDFVLSRYPNSDKQNIDNLLHIFDMEEAKNILLENYSFGMKKKIQIIAALLSNSKYILGDEIFSGLDFETTLVTLELFSGLRPNRGAVIVSHNKLIIERFPDNIYLMSNQKIEKFCKSVDDLEKEILNMEKVNDKIKWIQQYNNTN